MVSRRLRAQRGMTLVEIMITLVISSIIAASTFMFFAGQQRIYETQTKLLNIQQNLWASMEVVSRYTRAAGSGMFECVRPASYANATPIPGQEGSRLQSTFPSPGPLSVDLALDHRPRTGVRAHDGAGGMQWIPPLWIVNKSTGEGTLNVRPDTDIITVAFGNRTSGMDVDATLAEAFASTDGTIKLVGATSGDMFRLDEFILLLVTPNWGYGTNPTVDRGCTLFQITANPQGVNILTHGTSPWNPTGNVVDMLPGGGYTGNASGVRNFGTLTWVTFFIQQVGNGTPNLMMQQRHRSGDAGTPQILAEGIEDLQVSFACDTGTLGEKNLAALDGQLNEGYDDDTRRLDEWWNNLPNDNLPDPNTPGFCNLPTGIRITLVARTLTPDDLIDPGLTGNGPLDIEDHVYPAPPSRPTDSFRRRVLTTTVFPRNNKPL